MRTDNSIKNVKASLISQIVNIITKFIGRMIFVAVLSSEYLGINGLFTNILTLLSLADMGIDNALTYSMYKPLAEKNEKKLKELTNFYRKIYSSIATLILIVGLFLIPFLPYLIKDMPDISNINLIYILYLINTVISYLCVYKTSVITADQKGYIVTIYTQVFNIISIIATSIVLIITKQFIIYLIVQIMISVFSNIYMSKRAEKLYPCIKNVKGYEITSSEKKEIRSKTYALLFHKIGGVIVCGTDNIIISMLVGLKDVGIYSNYVMVTNAITTITSQATASITASVGNLNVDNNKDHIYEVFKKVNFINSWLATFCTVCLYILFNDFIKIWLGKNYIFESIVVMIIALKFYIEANRKSIMTFRNAMGIFEPDKWKSIIEAILNLVISIILGIKYGIMGILLGTIISMLIASVFVEAHVLYKYGFKKSAKEFYVNYIKDLLLTIIVLFVTYQVTQIVHFNGIVNFVIKMIITIVLSNVIIILFTFKTKEFKFCYALFKEKMKIKH